VNVRRPARAGFVAGLLAVVALAGCGGDDDDAPSASEPGPVGTEAPSTAPAGSGAPNATISPDLPDGLEGEVGPVEVRGASLPELGQATVADDPAVGMQAPVIIGQNFDGQPVRIDAASDGPTMVVFLAHWCPHCNREVPWINELRDASRLPENLNIVGVSTGFNPGRPNWPPSEWLEDLDWTYPVIADGIDMEGGGTYIAADAYGLDGFPFIVLIDENGNVTARKSGEAEPDDLIQFIEDNLAL
jgi:thiol-disulfide isomerase/thioredoxin